VRRPTNPDSCWVPQRLNAFNPNGAKTFTICRVRCLSKFPNPGQFDMTSHYGAASP